MCEFDHQYLSDHLYSPGTLDKGQWDPYPRSKQRDRKQKTGGGHKVTIAKTESVSLGHGQDVGVRWALVKLSIQTLPLSLPGSSVAGRMDHGSYLLRVPVGAVSIARKSVVSLSELRGAAHVAPEQLISLISVGSSYICL